MARYNTYTVQQERFLKENAPKMSRKALTELFNLRFGLCKSEQAIKSWCNSRGYNSASTGRFEKGCVTWQKGLSAEEIRGHYTEESFKRRVTKVAEANRFRKIGDEIVIDGVPWVIASVEYGVPLYNRRVPKRRWVWEKLHGEIPKDCCIICLDGNPMNCEPDNLYCMPIKFRALMSKNKWWSNDRELTLAAVRWCELHYAIRDCKEGK